VSITAGTTIAGAAVVVLVVRQIYTITPKHIGLVHIIPLHTTKQPFLYFVSLPLKKKKSVFTDWGFLSQLFVQFSLMSDSGVQTQQPTDQLLKLQVLQL